MLDWIRRHWPLAWTGTVRRLNSEHKESVDRLTASRDAARIQRDQGQVREKQERERAEVAEQRILHMQKYFESLMQARNGHEWDFHADKAMMLVDGRESLIRCIFTNPLVRSDVSPASNVVMLRMGFQIGLSEACPPELVAKQMADQVHSAILLQWAGQSVLLQLAQKRR